MLYPCGEAAWVDHLDTHGFAHATVTASDDLSIVIDTLRAHAARKALTIRVYLSAEPSTLRAEVRSRLAVES